MLSFEWDDQKNQLNFKRHGLAFDDVVDFLDDPHLIERLDLREDYGEERIIAHAMIRSRVFVIVYVERGSKLRLISARYATRDEANDYFKRNAI